MLQCLIFETFHSHLILCSQQPSIFQKTEPRSKQRHHTVLSSNHGCYSLTKSHNFSETLYPHREGTLQSRAHAFTRPTLTRAWPVPRPAGPGAATVNMRGKLSTLKETHTDTITYIVGIKNILCKALAPRCSLNKGNYYTKQAG